MILDLEIGDWLSKIKFDHRLLIGLEFFCWVRSEIEIGMAGSWKKLDGKWWSGSCSWDFIDCGAITVQIHEFLFAAGGWFGWFVCCVCWLSFPPPGLEWSGQRALLHKDIYWQSWNTGRLFFASTSCITICIDHWSSFPSAGGWARQTSHKGMTAVRSKGGKF